jgi:hypothetical protein
MSEVDHDCEWSARQWERLLLRYLHNHREACPDDPRTDTEIIMDSLRDLADDGLIRRDYKGRYIFPCLPDPERN